MKGRRRTAESARTGLDIGRGIATSPCRYGVMSYLETDEPIGKSLRVYGEWAQKEIEFLLSLCHEGSVVLDIGANVGTHTLAFSNRVGPHGRVYSFEPQPMIFALLKQNIEQNNADNVSVFSPNLLLGVG